MSFDAIFDILFKVFLIVLSFMFLIYSIVIYKQTQVMARTLQDSKNWLILMISFIQQLVAIILIIVAFLIL